MNYDRSRFESAKKQFEYFRRVQGHLVGIVDRFYKHSEKAHENYDLGFSRSYEQVVITSSMGLYRAFEDYLEFEFGRDVATYFSLMIAQNLFADLLELEMLDNIEPTEEEADDSIRIVSSILSIPPSDEEELKQQQDLVRQVFEIYERPNFGRFYYGFESAVFSPRWKIHFCQSLAYNLLPHWAGDTWDMDAKRLVAEYLAANVEICCDMIIEDIQERRFIRLLEAFDKEEIDIGNAMRFSAIYGITVMEMRDIDKKLIAVDEPTRFNLPEFGV
jgi:hypothetical protein